MLFKLIRLFAPVKRPFCQKTMKILNVAEKNDAAKNLADIMSNGRFKRREGLSKYNKIYEYPFVLRGQQVNMVMTSVSGHLLTYEFPIEYKQWNRYDPTILFDIPVMKYCPKDYQSLKRTLEQEVRSCQKLIIWTDCDREGENIGFEVIDVCRAVMPNIEVVRARFSEITQQAVHRAVNNLIAPDARVNDAVNVRQELDLRIGAAFTRFQTMRLRRVFPEALADQLISYGSCQFPTLGFVVERFKEVKNFQPEPFWKIKVVHIKDEKTVEFNWKRGRLFDRLCCEILVEHCLEEPTARVVSVSSHPKSKWRPCPLDTVELEKLASRKLRIGAKETMRIAERIYTQGYISYPRTETNIFPPELNLGGLVEVQTHDGRWSEFAQRVLQNGPDPRNGRKTDHAHPPIHPLKLGRDLQGNEARIYELVTRHFLACLSANATGTETAVEIDINAERFDVKGLVVLERNYLEVYFPYERWSDKELPVFELHETFVPRTIEMVDGKTAPPPLLTEADLIALMDKHGIGTDATHADHIETIKQRMYVGLKDDKLLVPGELGMGLVEGYDDMGFEMSKPNLRAELESDLKEISEGRKQKDAVLASQISKYREVFRVAVAQANKLDQALGRYFQENPNDYVPEYTVGEGTQQLFETVRSCPQCTMDAVVKKKAGDRPSWFVSCRGYPSCRYAIWFPDSVLHVRALADQPCPNHPVQEKVVKVALKLKRGAVPGFISPDPDEEYITCIFCDTDLQKSLGLRIAQRNSTQAPWTVTQVPTPTRPPLRDTPWNSVAPNNTSSSRMTSSSSGQMPRFTAVTNEDEQANEVVCNCAVTAVELIVKKEGPNKGRPFFKCGKGGLDQGGCDFFLWKDSSSSSGPSNLSYQRNNRPTGGENSYPPRQTSGSSWPPSRGGGESAEVADGVVMCKCEMQANLLTVQKESVNKGRQFFACARPRDQSCSFFQWADEAGSSSRDTGFNRKPAGRGGGAGPGKKPSVRKCGICGQPGHTRNKCPRN